MRNLLLALGFSASFATSALAEGAQCLKFRSLGREACRQDAAVAPVGGDGQVLAWGGRETRGCDRCSRMVFGNATGGLYDSQGRLLEPMASDDSPGARFGAQALWNGAAFFVWGGIVRQNERWVTDHHEVVSAVNAPSGAFYLPGIRAWRRMSTEGAPSAKDSRLELGPDGKVRVCAASGCKAFDMVSNTWSVAD
jgi:hypothetical protein